MHFAAQAPAGGAVNSRVDHPARHSEKASGITLVSPFSLINNRVEKSRCVVTSPEGADRHPQPEFRREDFR
jgi:hypothetical protein